MMCEFIFQFSVGILQDSSELEVIGSGSTVDYVWDDLTLPHKLVVKINGNFFSVESPAQYITFVIKI